MSKQQPINEPSMDAGKDDEKWDAAALLDGVYFDPQLHYEQQKARAATEGLIGVSRMTNTVAVLDASRIARGEGGMNAVVASFRDMKMGARWNPAPASVSHTRFFNKFGKEVEPLRKHLTVERIGSIRDAFPKLNPAQLGFRVNRHDTITLRFDDLLHVQDARALAALLILAGFEFVLDREPEKYVVFVSGEGQPVSKAIVTLRCTKRVMEVISGSRPFLLNNYPVSVRVYSINCVQKGRVLKLEGPICKWIKKMIALGIPLQQILWKIADCLILQGLTVRSVYLDDEGFKKRFVNVESPDFDVRVEFFSKEQAHVDLMYFQTKLVSEKHTIFEDLYPEESLIKVIWKLGSFVVRALQASHPYVLVMNIGEGAQSFRMLVEEALGTSSEAATIAYVESYFKRRAPHLQLGIVQPDVYGDDQVNFKKVRIHFEKQETFFKALLAIYSVVASRSEAFRANRLDFTVRDGEPFNDIACEVWDGNRQLRKYKERGEKDDSERKNDLDKRGWENDPINYFNQTWLRKVVTSPYEARIRKQANEREAGMKRELPMIGSTMERIDEREDGDDGDDYDPDAPDAEGDALLAADPVHGNFWFFEEPYNPPSLRTEPQPNPFLQSIDWHRTLFRVSPELILCEEWEYLQTDADIEYLSRMVLMIIAKWGQPFWAPAPGYNCLPMKPNTVPTPKLALKNKDFRVIWDTQLWTKDPAVVYKILARLVGLGWITQERAESGLCFEFGPRMLQDQIPIDPKPRTLPSEDEFHHFAPSIAALTSVPTPTAILYETEKPVEYLWGEGTELNDDDALLTARKLMSAIDDRGVICAPTSRYGDRRIPSILTRLNCAPEDNISNFIRSHVEYEAGHLGCIVQYILSTKRVTQVVSPQAGGVYLLSEDEQERRTAAGIDDADYVPTPWHLRPENPSFKSASSKDGVPPPKNQSEMEIEPEKPRSTPSPVKRAIQMGDAYVSSGHFEYLQHHILIKALDITVPRDVRQQLRHVASNLLPSVPQSANITTLAQDPSQVGQAHQDLARLALTSRLDPRIQLELAGVATDMQRMFLVRQQLKQIVSGQNLTEELQLGIVQSCEKPGFFSKIRSKLAEILKAPGLDEEGLEKLTLILNEDLLIQLSQTEAGGSGPGAVALLPRSNMAPRWDYFQTEARKHINEILEVPDLPVESTSLLIEALNDVSRQVNPAVEMCNMLDGSMGADVLFVRIASLSNFAGASDLGVQLGRIAVSVKRMTVCQSTVINATLFDRVPQAACDLAVSMSKNASFYTAVCQWLLDASVTASTEQRAQIMMLLDDDNVVRLTHGGYETWRGLSDSSSPPVQQTATAPLPLPSPSAASNLGTLAIGAGTTPETQLRPALLSSSLQPTNQSIQSQPPAGARDSIATDFDAMMVAQLSEIASTPGVTSHSVSLRLLERASAEFTTDVPLADMLVTICTDSDPNSVQHTLATLASETTMEMPIRLELAYIAVDLYKALRCHNRALFATSQAGNTGSVLALAAKMGDNQAFFDSIKTRIESASTNTLLSVAQGATVESMAGIVPGTSPVDTTGVPQKLSYLQQDAILTENTDFLTAMREQLAAIAATKGVKPEAISSLERVSAELGVEHSLEPSIAMILEDDNQKGLLQYAVATMVNERVMSVDTRTRLAQIAVDMYKAWRCHSLAVTATLHPSNPESARKLAGALGSNPSFYRAVQERLQAEASNKSNSEELQSLIMNIATHGALTARVAGASSAPNIKSGKSPKKRGSNSPTKGGGNGGMQDSSPSKKGGGKLDNKKDKGAARDDPLARPVPREGRGKP